MPSLHNLRQEFLNLSSLVIFLSFSIVYFSLSVLFLNFRLVLTTIFDNNPLSYKLRLFFVLITGAYSALSPLDLILLLLTAALVGINFLMIIKIFKHLRRNSGGLSLTIGGSAILGILVAGCSTCGFSVLSLVGLSGTLSFIPFGGLGLHLLAISLLIFSLFYSLKTLNLKPECKLSKSGNQENK
jgi:hypothetical protein